MTSTTDLLDRLLGVSAVLAEDQERFARRSGVTPARLHLLWVLGGGGPTSQRALAEALDIAPRTVTGLVDALVGSGHVTREANPHDRRSYLVTLTPSGRGFVESLARQHRELAHDLFGDLDDDAREQTAHLLDEVGGRLRRLLEDQP